MDSDLAYKFGYPTKCQYYSSCEIHRSIEEIQPYYQAGTLKKVMLIGQDPTIYDKPERVDTVLMLNETKGRNGQLRRWLRNELFGNCFDDMELYATNLVKCQFLSPPTQHSKKAFQFLEEKFENCKQYLYKEISEFKPDVVLTLGESTHLLFSKEIESYCDWGKEISMKNNFTGEFIMVKLKGLNFSFEYSPCLHIKTFRVAETYGQSVINFKKSLSQKMNNSRK